MNWYKPDIERMSRTSVSQADLRSAVYVVMDTGLAMSTSITSALLHSPVGLVCSGIFGVLAVFNASMIGKQ